MIWLDFGDLDPIFKAYTCLVNHCVGFDQNFMETLFG